ncbi:MAG: molecular chaperone TorD family protein [Anaerolineae bacterium]
MTNPITTAYRLLGHFWLEEVKPDDTATIVALPELAQTLPNIDAAALSQLAVEYQRLFGFNLPPYESVFIDPTAMLMAPATERVQRLYGQAGWQPPEGTRSGAPDHLGLELLALADWQDAGQTGLAAQLHQQHLALWLPAFAQTLRRLKPHPFYAALADLTEELILSTLPQSAAADNDDPFPQLPPPPVFRGSGPDEFAGTPAAGQGEALTPLPPSGEEQAAGEEAVRLRDIVKRLLPPCDTGLYLTREDIARMAQALNMPASMGDRYKMLETLFRQAGEFDLLPRIFHQFNAILDTAHLNFEQQAESYPRWQRYAIAWQRRLDDTKSLLRELAQVAASNG